MPSTDTPRYTLTELAGLAGVTPRTVRYYMAQGLLPAVATSGPGAKYGDAQLARLRLIRRLQRDHLPLASIRQQLAGLDNATVLRLSESPSPPADSALDYIRRVLGGQSPHSAASPSPSATAVGPPSPTSAGSVSPTSASAPARPAAAPDSPTAALPGPLPAPSIPAPHASTPAPAAPAERQLQRAQWERIGITPDIELHVRRPLPRTIAKRVDRLISIARDLLEEDQP